MEDHVKSTVVIQRHTFAGLLKPHRPDDQFVFARRQRKPEYPLAIGSRAGGCFFMIDAGKGYRVTVLIGYTPRQVIRLRLDDKRNGTGQEKIGRASGRERG